MTHSHNANPLALGAAMLTIILWSSSYAAISYGLRYFTPGQLILLRFVVASACFVVPIALRWIRLPPRRDWPAVIMLGLIGNTAYQLSLSYSMTRISPGSAAVVISLAPAITTLFAMLKLKERPGIQVIVGIIIAFVGTLLVILGRGNAIRLEPVALLAFVAVLCNSSYFVWQKPLLTRTSPLGFTAATLLWLRRHCFHSACSFLRSFSTHRIPRFILSCIWGCSPQSLVLQVGVLLFLWHPLRE